jgi:hypothetical protein
VALEQMLMYLRGGVLVEQVDGDEARALLAQLCCKGAQTLLTARDEDERCPGLAGKALRRRLAKAAGGAGDDCYEVLR